MTELSVIWDGRRDGANRGLLNVEAHEIRAAVDAHVPAKHTYPAVSLQTLAQLEGAVDSHWSYPVVIADGASRIKVVLLSDVN